MTKRSLGILGVCALLVAAVPVAAHHAIAAQYDMDKPVEITGTLNKMEFINPHSMLHLDVKNPDGSVTTWVFQTTNAGTLRSRGLARTGPGSLEHGSMYTVKGFAARNGNPMGFLRVLVFPDKKELTFWFGDPNGN
jgi:DNA/RNA endonuclease YhcR with UshA esterase domain